MKAVTRKAHKDLAGLVVKGGAKPVGDGVVSGVAGATATKMRQITHRIPAGSDRFEGSVTVDRVGGERIC